MEILGIRQVKVPVSDLQRSVDWYRKAFGLRLGWEFVEDGEVAGAVLTDEGSTFLIGLRRRDVVPGEPAFVGFDLFSLGVGSVEALEALAKRLDDLGIAHDPPFDRGPDGGVHLDVPDPDGTVIRILTPFGTPTFTGIEFHPNTPPTSYKTPRLT